MKKCIALPLTIHSKEDALDVIQESFEKALKAIKKDRY